MGRQSSTEATGATLTMDLKILVVLAIALLGVVSSSPRKIRRMRGPFTRGAKRHSDADEVYGDGVDLGNSLSLYGRSAEADVDVGDSLSYEKREAEPLGYGGRRRGKINY